MDIEKNIKSFNENGYCVVKQAIDENTVTIITQYALFDRMQNFSPEPDHGVMSDGKHHDTVMGAHAKYGDPMMETMLLYFQELVEINTGKQIFPTYSYYRVYTGGDILKAHYDREACEISVTMALDNSYRDTGYTWPIYVGEDPVYLDPGDLVIYKGVEKRHHREKLNFSNEEWHVQAFFHYVDQNGPYAEYKFDKREGIGLL